jgi:hypothetical protein
MPEIDFTIIENLRKGCNELESNHIKVMMINLQPQIQCVVESAAIGNLQLCLSLENAIETAEGTIRYCCCNLYDVKFATLNVFCN